MMNATEQNSEQEYTYDEYLEQFAPQAYERRISEERDPHQIGHRIVMEALAEMQKPLTH